MLDANGTAKAEPARLLLVDRDGALGRKLAAPLSAGLGRTPIVVELTAGRPALELLKSSPFDGLIADLSALGDLAEGVDERIGRLARTAAGALIVALSDDSSISVTLSAMRAGAHDCASAGLAAEALVARISELAHRHGKPRLCAAKVAPAEPQAPEIPVMRNLVLPMWQQEQRIIEDAIQSFAGNIALAAAALELSPSTIYRKRQAWAEMGAKRA